MKILIADDKGTAPDTQAFFAGLAGKRSDGTHATTRLLVSLCSKPRPNGEPERVNISLDDQQEHSSAVLDALGLALVHSGSIDEARPLIEEALRIRREFYGEDHPATAASLISRGRLLRRSGEIEAAAIEVRRALTINSRMFGAESLPVAITLSELATIEIQLGDYTEAEQSAQTGLRILEALHLQCTDPHVTRLMDSLGRVNQIRGNYDRATEIYTSLLDLDRKQVGDTHLKYATHLANFATVEAAQGKLDAARDHFERAITIYEDEVKLPRHPDLVDAYANIGSLWRARGELDKACEALQKALTLDLETRGPDHPYVGNDHSRLGRAEYERNRLADAENCFTAALEVYGKSIAARKLPADHAYIAEAKTWKARVILEAGGAARAYEAEQLIGEALQIWQIEFGERSVEQSIANAILGHALFLQGRERERASGLLNKSYAIVASVRGADSKIALLIRKWVDSLSRSVNYR